MMVDALVLLNCELLPPGRSSAWVPARWNRGAVLRNAGWV